MGNFCIKDITFHNKLIQDFEPEFIDVFLSDKINLDQEYISDEAYDSLYNDLTNNYFRSTQFFDEARQKLFEDAYIKDTLRLFVPESVADRIIQTGKNSKTYTDLLSTYNRILDLKTGYKDMDGNLVLGGGTLFLKNHKDIEDYILRNKFNTFRRGSMEDFYDILGLNGTNYSFGNVVSDFSSSDVLNSLNRFLNQMVEESDVIEDKLSELSEATGIKVKVLDSEDFYKELLDKIKDKNIYNLKNPTRLKQYLETKKAFYYVDENGETFIYFNKDYLSYETVSHEFMHFVVDVIEKEDPEFLEELYNYINIKFEDKVKERINVYGEESIYTDESIKKEILVEILTDITNLNTVKSDNPNIFKKIFTYIKRFILHILGLNYSEKRNLSLSLLLDDDLFLNNSINKINSILQKEGFITNLYRGLGSQIYFNTVINDHIASLINSIKYITPLIAELRKENSIALISNIDQLLKLNTLEKNAINDESIIRNISSLLLDLNNVLRTINNIYPAFSAANGIYRLFEINEDLIQEHYSDKAYNENKRIDKLFEIYELNDNNPKIDIYDSLHKLFLKRFNLSVELSTKDKINTLKSVSIEDEKENLKYRYKMKYFVKTLNVFAYYDFVNKLYSNNIPEDFKNEIFYKLINNLEDDFRVLQREINNKINTLKKEQLNLNAEDEDYNNKYESIQNEINEYENIKNELEKEIDNLKKSVDVDKIRDEIKNELKRYFPNTSQDYVNSLNGIDFSITNIVNNLFNSIYNYFYFVKSKNEDDDAQSVRDNAYFTFIEAMIRLYTGKKSKKIYEMSNIINNSVISRKIYKYKTGNKQKKVLKKINRNWLINTHQESSDYLSVPFVVRVIYARGQDNMIHELNNRIDGFYIGYLSQIFYAAMNASQVIDSLKGAKKETKTGGTPEKSIYDEITKRLERIKEEQGYHSYIYFLNLLKRFELRSAEYSERTVIGDEKIIKIMLLDLLCRFSETGRFDFKYQRDNREDLRSFLYYMVLSLLYNHTIASSVLNIQNYNFEKYFKDFLNELTDRIRKGKTGFIERILKGDFENLEQDLIVLKVEIDQAIQQANKNNNIRYNENLSFSQIFENFKNRDMYHRIDKPFIKDYTGFFDFLLQREGLDYFKDVFRQIKSNYDRDNFNNHLINSLYTITDTIKTILDELDDFDLEVYLRKIKPFSNTLHEQFLLNKEKKGDFNNFIQNFIYFMNGISLHPDMLQNQEAIRILNLGAIEQSKAAAILPFILDLITKNSNAEYGENSNAKTVISNSDAISKMLSLDYKNAEKFFKKLLISEKISDAKRISGDIEIDTVESFVRFIPKKYDQERLSVNVLYFRNGKYQYRSINYTFKSVLNKFDNPYRFLSEMYKYEISKGMTYMFNYFGKRMDVKDDPLDKIRNLFNEEFFNRNDVMTEEDFYVFFIKVIKLLKDDENEIKEPVRKHLLSYFENYLNLRKLDSYIGNDFSEVAEKETAIIENIVNKLKTEDIKSIDVGELTFYLFVYFNEYIKENNPFKANFNIALNDPANTTINDLNILNDDSSDAVLFKNASRFMGFITSRSNQNKFDEMIKEKEFEFEINNEETKNIKSQSIITKAYESKKNQQNQQGQQPEEIRIDNTIINDYKTAYDNFLSVAEQFAYSYSFYRHMLDKNTKLAIKNIINNFITNKEIYIPFVVNDNRNYVYMSNGKYTNLYEFEKRLLPMFDFNKEAYVLESNNKITLRTKYMNENKEVINDFIDNKLEDLLKKLIEEEQYAYYLNKIKEIIKSIVSGFINQGENARFPKMYDHLFNLKKYIDENQDINILKYLFFNSRDFNLSLIELTKIKKEDRGKGESDIKNIKALMLYMYLLGGSTKNFILNKIDKEHLISGGNKYKIMKRFKETEEIYNVEFKEFNDRDDNSIKEAAIQLLDGIMTYPVLSFGSVLNLMNDSFLKELNNLSKENNKYNEIFIYPTDEKYSEIKIDFTYFQKLISDLPGFIDDIYNDIVRTANDDKKVNLNNRFKEMIGALYSKVSGNEAGFDSQFLVISGNNLFNNTNSDVFYNYRNIIGSNSEHDMYNKFTLLFGQFSKSGVMSAFHNIFSYDQRTLTEAGMGSAHAVGNHPIGGNSERGKQFTIRVLHDLLNNMFGIINKKHVNVETYETGVTKFMNYLTQLNEESKNKRYGLDDLHVYHIDDRLTVTTQEFLNKYLFTEKINTFKEKYDQFINSLQESERQDVPEGQKRILSFFSFIPKLFKDGNCITNNFNDISSSATALSFINSKSGKKGLQYLSRSFVNNDFRNFKKMLYETLYMTEIDDVVAYELYMLLESFYEGGYRRFVDQVSTEIQNRELVKTSKTMMEEQDTEGVVQEQADVQTDQQITQQTEEGQTQVQSEKKRIYATERYVIFLDHLYKFLNQNKESIQVKHVVNDEESRNLFERLDEDVFSKLGENKNVLYLLLYFNSISAKYFDVEYLYKFISEEGIEEITSKYTFKHEFVEFIKKFIDLNNNYKLLGDINTFFNFFLKEKKYKHVSPNVDAKDNLYHHIKNFIKNLQDIDDALSGSLDTQKIAELYYYYNDDKFYESITVNAIRLYFDEIIIKSGNLIFNRDSLQNVFTENLSFDVAFSFAKTARSEISSHRYESVLFESLKNDFFVKPENKSLFEILNENGMDDNFYKSFLDIYNDILDRLYVNTTFNVLQSHEDYNLFMELSKNQNAEYTVPLLPTVKDALIPKTEDTGEYDNTFELINTDGGSKIKSLKLSNINKYTDIFDVNHNAKKATDTYTSEDSFNLSYSLMTTLFSPIFKFLKFTSKVITKERMKRLFGDYFDKKADEPKIETVQLATAKDIVVTPEVIHKAESTRNISFIEKFLTGRLNVFVLLYDHIISSSQKRVIQKNDTFIYKIREKTVRPVMKRIRTFGDNLFNQLNKRKTKDLMRSLLNLFYTAFMTFVFIKTMDSFISVTIFLFLQTLFVYLKMLKQTGGVFRSLGMTFRYLYSVAKSTLMLISYVLLRTTMRAMPGSLLRWTGLGKSFNDVISSLGLPREIGRWYLGEHGTTSSVRSFTLFQSLSNFVSMSTIILTNPIFVKNYLESLASNAASESAFSSIVISNKGDKVLFFGDIFEIHIHEKQAFIRLKPDYERNINILHPDVLEIVRMIEKSPVDSKGINIGVPFISLYNNKFLSDSLVSAADFMNVANSYSALRAGIYDTNSIYVNVILPFASLVTNGISLFLRHIKSFIWSKWFIAYILGAYGLTVVNSLNPFYIGTKLSDAFSTVSFSANQILFRLIDLVPDNYQDISDILSSIAGSPLNVIAGLLFSAFAYYTKSLFTVKHNPELRSKHCIFDAECTSFMLFFMIGLVLLSYNTYNIIKDKIVTEHQEGMAFTYALKQQNLLPGEITPGVIPLDYLYDSKERRKMLAFELLTAVYNPKDEKYDKNKIMELTNYIINLQDIINYYNTGNINKEDAYEKLKNYKTNIDSISSFSFPTKTYFDSYIGVENLTSTDEYLPLNFRVGIASLFYFGQLTDINSKIIDIAISVATSEENLNELYKAAIKKDQKSLEILKQKVKSQIEARAINYYESNISKVISDFMDIENYKLVVKRFIQSIIDRTIKNMEYRYDYGINYDIEKEDERLKSFKEDTRLYINSMDGVAGYKKTINEYINILRNKLKEELSFHVIKEYKPEKIENQLIEKGNRAKLSSVLKKHEDDINTLKQLIGSEEQDYSKMYRILRKILPDIIDNDNFIADYLNYKTPKKISSMFDNFNKSLFSTMSSIDLLLGIKEKMAKTDVIRRTSVDGRDILVHVYAQELMSSRPGQSNKGIPITYQDVVTQDVLMKNAAYNLFYENFIKASDNISLTSDIKKIPSSFFATRRGVSGSLMEYIKWFTKSKEPRVDETNTEMEKEKYETNEENQEQE